MFAIYPGVARIRFAPPATVLQPLRGTGMTNLGRRDDKIGTAETSHVRARDAHDRFR